MKRIAFLILACFFGLAVYAQEENAVEPKTAKKLTKQEKAEQRKIDEEAKAKLVDWMVQNRQFVLKADYLSNQTGQRVIVNERLNFIIIDTTQITIQLAATTGIGGTNGLGGITADGAISQFDMKRIGKTNQNYSIHLFTTTHVGSYDIFLDISPSGNADATISGTTSGKLNYHGEIVPIKQAKIYKGMSL